jgi:iron complex outermembrane receptor protein
MMRIGKGLRAFGCAALLGSVSTAALAQATSETTDTGAVQEIVVTAQKRSETVSKVPLAITALSMDQLKSAGVTDVKGLAAIVPGLQIQTVGVDSFVGVTLRGISNRSYSPSANSAVSTYVDGAYVDLPVGFAESLYDLNRVEVLRGPQGTLYGRSATGGNINILTADPTHTFDASADASFGSYNDIQTHAMVNVPVSDTLAIRAAVMTHRSDGFYDTQGTTGRNYGAADNWGGRLTALWTPTDKFAWRVSLDHYQSEGTPGLSVQSGDDGMPVNGRSPFEQPVYGDPEPDNHIESNAIRSRMTYKLSDSFSLSYVASYQKIDAFYYWATSGNLDAPAYTGWQQYSSYASTAQFHEANLSYDKGRFKNVMGASYFDEDIPDTGSAGIYKAINYMYNAPASGGAHKSSWGVFDQGTFSVTEKLSLTAGIRYSQDSQSQSGRQSYGCSTAAYPDYTLADAKAMDGTTAGCYGVSNSVGAKGSWSKLTWKVGADYNLSSTTLLYASATTGYKPGGVQPGVPAGLKDTYSPENVTSYEAGWKSRLMDNTVNLRAAVFSQDYDDLQVFQLISTTAGVSLLTLNAAKARIYGLELEGNWRASSDDRVSGFINLLSAKYLEYNDAIDNKTGASVGSLKGQHLPGAPEFSARVQYTHDFHLQAGGTITPLIGASYQSESFSQPYNVGYYRIVPFTKTNLSLTYKDPGATWEVSAYVDNLEDKIVRTGDWASSGEIYSDYAPPRTFGVRVSKKM